MSSKPKALYTLVVGPDIYEDVYIAWLTQDDADRLQAKIDEIASLASYTGTADYIHLKRRGDSVGADAVERFLAEVKAELLLEEEEE